MQLKARPVQVRDASTSLYERDLKELNSRMQVLLMHLLKWRMQPDKRSSSWQSTIVTQRIEIDAILDQSPSLRAGLQPDRFPRDCPFTVVQILDEDFLPE